MNKRKIISIVILLLAVVAIGLSVRAIVLKKKINSVTEKTLQPGASQPGSGVPAVDNNFPQFNDGLATSNDTYGFKIDLPKDLFGSKKEIVRKISDDNCKDCAVVTIALPTKDEKWPAVKDENGAAVPGYAEIFNVVVVDAASKGVLDDKKICEKEFSSACPDQNMVITKSDKYAYLLKMAKDFPDDLKNVDPHENALGLVQKNFSLTGKSM